MRTRDQEKEALVKSTAMTIIAQEGINGFSMQKLAKAAGISPATLYIYFEDKEDLIIQLGIEEGHRMSKATMKNFTPELKFREGLAIQWKNRAEYWLTNPLAARFYESLKHTPYRDRISEGFKDEFKEKMGAFVHNAVRNRECISLPLEVFWSIAYAPLYNLIRFHVEGQSLGGRIFTWSYEIMEQTLDIVVHALKPR